MDKKTYTEKMAKIADGEKVSQKVFDELVTFAKAKKIKQPPKTAIAAPKARTKKAPKEKAKCIVTAKEDPAVGKKGCQKDARALHMCVAHYSRLVYRQDEKRAEKVREASRKYAAKKRAEKKALQES